LPERGGDGCGCAPREPQQAQTTRPGGRTRSRNGQAGRRLPAGGAAAPPAASGASRATSTATATWSAGSPCGPDRPG